jgi:hypothetical protein
MHRPAIITAFLAPSGRRGARVKAHTRAGAKTLAYDHALSAIDNHKAAAKALATKLDMSGYWVAGLLPNGTSSVFVLVAEYAPSDEINDIEIAFSVKPR